MSAQQDMPPHAEFGSAGRTKTPQRIRPLSHALANQISAGEVIERPASVLKELLENSLDAGARRIEIEAESAGVGLIRVRDDGVGIHPDDLELALRAHATSKVSTLADLERIESLGFRGEALPSIAAVSRLTLTSRIAGSADGWEVSSDGGVIGARRPAAGVPGTLVSVRELFFNTPGRRKFLRTERTEYRHLEDAVRRIALSRFDLAVSFRHNGRDVLGTAAADDGDRRVARICGRAFADHAVRVDFEAPDLRLRGWIGPPSAARGATDLQYFFVNGRSVRDTTARHAIRQAYDNRIPPGRYPAYVLYLDMDTAAVDVNVHPAKSEVRFREARLVHDFIWRHLARSFESAPIDSTGATDQTVPTGSAEAGTVRDPGCVSDGPSGYRGTAHVGAGTAPTRRPGQAGGTDVTVIDRRYAVVNDGGGLLLVDLASARRVLLREALRAAVESGPAPSRPLLLPVPFDVSENEADRVEKLADMLSGAGFELRRTAPGALAAHAVPAVLAHVPAATLVAAVLRWSGERGQAELSALGEALAGLGAEHLDDLLATAEALESFLRSLERHAEALTQAGAWRRLDAHELGALLRRGRGGIRREQ